ncbi:MAG: AbrB family transcriptional regulator [Chloroflexota bacterium]
MSQRRLPTLHEPLRRLGLTPRLALTLAIGAAGMFLARWSHFPGGAITGVLIITGAARLLGAPLADPPAWLKSLGRILLGLALGTRVTPATITAIVNSFGPVMLMIAMMMGLGVIIAYAMQRYARMPLVTALCSSAPGGLSAMVVVSEELGGEGAVVASMQLVRFFTVQMIVPVVVRARFPMSAAAAPLGATAAPEDILWRLGVLLIAGVLVGLLADRYKVPSGSLLAGMILGAVLNPLWLRLPGVPSGWQLVSQVIIGAGVGVTLTRAALRTFRPYALPGLLMTAGLIVSGLALGWALDLVTELDLVTSIVGSAPGGADTMIILASELGADPQLVAAMHTARLLLIVLLMPVLVRLMSGRRAAQPQVAQSS